MSEIMEYFKYEHLPKHLQDTSKPFCELARTIDRNHSNNAEKSTTLRKLLEAKDTAVRSRLYTNANAETMVNSTDSSHRI